MNLPANFRVCAISPFRKINTGEGAQVKRGKWIYLESFSSAEVFLFKIISSKLALLDWKRKGIGHLSLSEVGLGGAWWQVA